MKWYSRSGCRLSEKQVQQTKEAASYWIRTGINLKHGLRRNPNPALADRIDSMSLIEYANYCGAYSYRNK